MARITIEERMEKIMSVVNKPDPDLHEIRTAVADALQDTEDYGFRAGERWQKYDGQKIEVDDLIALIHVWRKLYTEEETRRFYEVVVANLTPLVQK